ECARILKPGGRLMSGLDNGINFLFSEEDESRIVNTLPFDPVENEEQRKLLETEDAGMQFSHDIGVQIGGQIRAGFRLVDVYEDTNGEGFLHDHHVPAFFATLSVRE
ncbi:MAG: SAM-dependent methyltransferase, partial [Lachnospiraceae bacterium]|nr:SAM-dependent methyltransferase [Lachnospiraceae bacterium]